MAWGSQMQNTYYGHNYWVPKRTVCAVRCSRLCGQRQRKPIHISRTQGVLRNIPNKAHNHTAISPNIKRPCWTFCWHVKATTQKCIRYPDGQGTIAISAGIQNNTQSQYTTGSLTNRNDVCQKKKNSVFDKLLPKQNMLRKTTLAPKKWFNPGEKISF